MKKITLITLALALGVSVYAQIPMRPHRAKLPPRLEAELKLTPEQQIKVTEILKNRNFEMDSLAKSVRVRNGRYVEAKMKSEMTEVNGKLYAIFNTDQKLVYAQYIMNRQTQMEKGRKPAPDRAKLPPRLEAELKLTPEQQIKVAEILKNRNFEMDSLAKSVRVRNGRYVEAKMKSEMTEVNGKLYAIFNID